MRSPEPNGLATTGALALNKSSSHVRPRDRRLATTPAMWKEARGRLLLLRHRPLPSLLTDEIYGSAIDRPQLRHRPPPSLPINEIYGSTIDRPLLHHRPPPSLPTDEILAPPSLPTEFGVAPCSLGTETWWIGADFLLDVLEPNPDDVLGLHHQRDLCWPPFTGHG